ncbi:MAG: polysaccharide biosynthesis protein [Spirochaetaceae bacterium]
MTATRRNRIYIIGAGLAGISIARDIREKRFPAEIVAFLDDDREKIGTRIDNVPVLGPIEAAASLVEKRPADEALIAIPSASHEKLRSIYAILERAGFSRIRILPGISQMMEGDAHFIQTREVDPQDLLGRTPAKIGLKESLSYLRGKRVLITGAGGSIGSELSRQLLSGGAERLYLFGHGENSIYEIDRELRLLQEEGVGERATIVPVIGEIQDEDFVRFILDRLKADVIFHTAAYKHVPMVEANPVVAVKNNVFGTHNLLEGAKAAGTERFVLISTDKVVEPVSVYGVSKRIAEELVLSQPDGRQQYMVVRFGNVLGSRGSILPLFRKQIAKGGPITITSPGAKRFFMTITEAASLVLKAGGVGSGGNLYLLDMGEPIAIKELAEQLVRFYGYEPGSDIPFSYIGMRAGEKEEEALYAPDEHPVDTEFPRIKQIIRAQRNGHGLSALLERLAPVCFLDPAAPDRYRDRRELRRILSEYVPSLKIPEHEPQY